MGETGNPRGRRGFKEKEKGRDREEERDAPGHEVGEPREGRSFPPSLPSRLPPFTPPTVDLRRHTGTFSYSFSVPSLVCTETDDDDDDDGDDNNSVATLERHEHTSRRLRVVYAPLRSYSSLAI